MGILDIFKSNNDIPKKLAQEGFEISHCEQECGSCGRFPKTLKIEHGDDLWGTAKPFGLHIVVSTNKADWKHDAIDEPGSVQHAADQWAQRTKADYLEGLDRIKVSVSSISSEKFHKDPEYDDGTKGDLLLLPFFVWIKEIKSIDVISVLDYVLPILAKSRDKGETSVPKISLEGKSAIRIEPAVEKAFVFLCSHKTRDKRCGITAPIMKREMEIHLRDLGLYRDLGDSRPGGVQIAYTNHVGGHKYAANVIIYLKKSGKHIWMARCTPNNAVPLIDECIVNDGKVWPEKLRLIQKFSPIEW